MAFDAFLVFTTLSGQPTLKGETQDKQFRAQNALEISEFSFGIHNTVNIGSVTSGAGAGKAQFADLKIAKVADSLTPNLLLYVGNGAHIQQLDLYVRQASSAAKGGAAKSGLVYLQYSFKLVAVTTVDWSGSSGDDAVKENVTFTYGALQVKHTAQKGARSTTSTATWNRITNGPGFDIPGIG